MMVRMRRQRQRFGWTTTTAAAAAASDESPGALRSSTRTRTRIRSRRSISSNSLLLLILVLLLSSAPPGARHHNHHYWDGGGGGGGRSCFVAGAAAFTAAAFSTTSPASLRERRRRTTQRIHSPVVQPAFLSSDNMQQQRQQQSCGRRRTAAIVVSLRPDASQPLMAATAEAERSPQHQRDAAADGGDDEETAATATIQRAAHALRGCQTPAELRLVFCDATCNGNIDDNDEGHPSNVAVAAAAAALRRLTQLAVLRNREKASHNTLFARDAGELLPILLRPIQQQAVQQQQCDPTMFLPPTRRTVEASVDAVVSLDLMQRRGAFVGLRDDEEQEDYEPLQRLLCATLNRWEQQLQQQDSGGSGSGSGKRSRDSSSNSNSSSITQTLSPSRLVHCLRALSCGNDRETASSNSRLLFQNLCARLRQGDVLARLSPFDLVTLLSTFAAASATTTDIVSSSSSGSQLLLLVKAVARRLRKKQVRVRAPTVSLIYALDATRRLWLKLPQHNDADFEEKEDGGAVAPTTTILQDVRRELQLMTYSLTRQVILNVNSSDDESSASIKKEDETAPTLSSIFSIWTPSHAATVCHSAQEVLCVSADDSVVQSLCDTLQNSAWTRGTVQTHDLARILEALSKWQQKDAFPKLTETLGQHFAATVQECMGDANGSRHPRPCDVNVILRSVAFLGSPSIPEQYLTAATQLFLDPSFLKKCSALVLSNFAWFVAFKADGYWHSDDKVRNSLAYRILDTDILVSCTPTIACRILNAFTELYCSSSSSSSSSRPNSSTTGDALAATNEQPQNSILLSSLFSSLGEQLLSTQLSPLDFSSAIYAYSKSSYVFDIGIFDHLVELMASRVSECTLRQISQSLWACGKMAQWESVNQEDEVATFVEPPYLKSASHLATYLSFQVDELCPKDVAQSLWALARLQLHGVDLVEPLVERAEDVAEEMNSQEVANSLWALSKLETSNSKAIFALTRGFSQPMEPKAVKPQEASNILYALAKMDIRDDVVFRNLSKQMLDQIDASSAQDIANALWAHRAVHIEPPQTLLNIWAKQKLGLVAVAQRDPDYLYY